jgi:uncharacterized protein YacL
LFDFFKKRAGKEGDFIRAPRPGQLLLLILRGVFLAMVIGLATQFVVGNLDLATGMIIFALVLLAGVVTVTADIASRTKQITLISAVYFGLISGFVLGDLFWTALKPVVEQYITEYMRLQPSQRAQLEAAIRLLIIIITCYSSISVLIQTKDEYRFIIPYVEFSKQVRGGRPLVLDTSVIIDGRIADICETGVIDSKLVVPRFVLQELQSIADSSDKIKRNRGRRGLDILKKLQSNTKVELQIHEGNLAELRDVYKVDERLVVLAKYLSGRVVTNDFNLNKVAQLQGVDVINLNELANSLKLVALPGEHLTIRIIKQGDQMGQGVGYLDDGTMVVVEQGKSVIGQEVPITVTSVLQTPAGRMIFGRLDSRSENGGHHKRPDGS